jgi:Lon protease-like protein
VCRGERRFRLLGRATRPDGLHVGEVEWLPEDVPTPLPAAQQPLVQLLRRVLGELGTTARFLEPRYDDAGWIGCRCAELLPLDVAAQQRLLEIDDPAERLRQIASLLDVATD